MSGGEFFGFAVLALVFFAGGFITARAKYRVVAPRAPVKSPLPGAPSNPGDGSNVP